MASILNRGGLALALIILIVVSSSISFTDARRPYNRVRQLAEDCNSPTQGEIPGCGSGGGSGGPSTPNGSNHCENGCCKKDKFGECVCC